MQTTDLFNTLKGVSDDIDKVLCELQETSKLELKQKLNSEYGRVVTATCTTRIIVGGRATGKTYDCMNKLIIKGFIDDEKFVYVKDVTRIHDLVYVVDAQKDWRLHTHVLPDLSAVQVKSGEKVLGLLTTPKNFFANPDKFDKASNFMFDDLELKDDKMDCIDCIEDFMIMNNFSGMVYMVGRRAR